MQCKSMCFMVLFSSSPHVSMVTMHVGQGEYSCETKMFFLILKLVLHLMLIGRGKYPMACSEYRAIILSWHREINECSAGEIALSRARRNILQIGIMKRNIFTLLNGGLNEPCDAFSNGLYSRETDQSDSFM